MGCAVTQDITFFEACKILAVRTTRPENYFQLQLASRQPPSIPTFFQELRLLARWHQAELPHVHDTIERTFHRYFPLKTMSPTEKLLAQFFSHTSERFSNESEQPPASEFITLRDWVSEDATPHPDYAVNTQAFTFRNTFYDLFHSEDREKTEKAMRIFKDFLQLSSVTDETLMTFLCQQLNQDGMLSITKPLKDYLLQKNAGYTWEQVLFTLHITTHTDLAYPALDVELVYFFQKKILLSTAVPLDPNPTLRYLLRTPCPEFIGRYTLVAIDGTVHFIKPSYEITLHSPDSPLLQRDLQTYLDTLKSTVSTPFVTPISSPIPASPNPSIRSRHTPYMGPCIIS